MLLLIRGGSRRNLTTHDSRLMTHWRGSLRLLRFKSRTPAASSIIEPTSPIVGPYSGADAMPHEGRQKFWRGRRAFFRASIILAVVARHLGADALSSGGAFAFPVNRTRPMPRCTVVRRVHFNAAHRLHNPARSDDWNRTTFGPCNNPNYPRAQLRARRHGRRRRRPRDRLRGGRGNPQGDLEREVTSALDHKNLNLDVPWFAEHPPLGGEHRGLHLGPAGGPDAAGTAGPRPPLGNAAQLGGYAGTERRRGASRPRCGR